MNSLSLPKTCRHFIDGNWLSGLNHQDNHNPSQWHEILGRYPLATSQETSQAVQAARKAYPPWRRTSRIKRGELFDNLAQLVKRETDTLALLMAKECGKVITECRAEVVEGLHMIQHVFGTSRMACGEVFASEIAEKIGRAHV